MTTAELESHLRRFFGHSEFRPGQRALVESLIAGRDALGVMPTGGGKSLCFPLPAALLEGTALVISPLIALMKDQVDALRARGIHAEAYNSALDFDQRRSARDAIAAGRVKLLYIAPERLQAEGFLDSLGSVPLSFLAIDEAHCISHWGHDFRPDYHRLGQLRKLLAKKDGSRLPCIALTATATQRVQADIVERLEMAEAAKVITGFRRPNLAFEVRQVSGRAEKASVLRESIDQALAQGGSAVIYAATRKNVERVADELKRPYRAGYYHAGLEDEERVSVQDRFLKGECRVLVATNAFGMGIDKSDVRLVAHYDIPGSVEAYYQEAGRAGRDGKPARCLLLFNYADVATQQFFIDKNSDRDDDGGESSDGAGEHAAVQETLLKQLVRYAYANDCRQKLVLEYFGDSEASGFEGCGECDSCKPVARGELKPADEKTTLSVRQALAAVARMHGRYGKLRVCEVLKGSDTEAVRAAGLQTLSTYGLLKDWSMNAVRDLLNQLVDAGYVRLTGLDYPVVSLSQEGLQALKGETPVALRSGFSKTSKTRAAAKSTSDSSNLGPVDFDEELFEKLKAYRAEQARELGVPAYVVFHDRTLKELAAAKPKELAELEGISGFGPKKLEKYGAAVLGMIKA